MRAQRLPLTLPVQYRSLGQEWIESTTLNISRSGVLFRSSFARLPDLERALVIQAQVEIRILLGYFSAGVTELDAEGRIVRLESPGGRDLAVAVMFSACELRPARRRSLST